MKSFDKRSAARDVYGAKRPETFGEYFDFERWPDKATQKVTRNELVVILDRIERARRQNTLRSRLWRWLKARAGSGPVQAVEDAPHEKPEQSEEVAG